MNNQNQLLTPIDPPSGIFTVSIDFELLWGRLYSPKWRRFRNICYQEKQELIERLLAVLAEYRIPATWCVVGHLFFDSPDDCWRGTPEMAAAVESLWGPDSPRKVSRSDREDPVFYGRNLVEKILSCATPQEIGSHTFTHVLFNHPSCTREVASTELAASIQASKLLGLRPTVLAFPRNRINHVDLLARHGFTAFRGQDLCWYERTNRRRWYHRLGHLAEIIAAAAPPAVEPVWHGAGIWEIPGSMLYTPSYGVRRFVPAALRVSRARKGLEAAVRERRIFHLWFHPTDLVVRMDAMLDGLRRIFEQASELRAAGKLQVLPMGGIVTALSSGGEAANRGRHSPAHSVASA
jgi:peptidoglycan/xylan/chitin deacetylase (PgdA/CDA1 family)